MDFSVVNKTKITLPAHIKKLYIISKCIEDYDGSGTSVKQSNSRPFHRSELKSSLAFILICTRSFGNLIGAEDQTHLIIRISY